MQLPGDIRVKMPNEAFMTHKDSIEAQQKPKQTHFQDAYREKITSGSQQAPLTNTSPVQPNPALMTPAIHTLVTKEATNDVLSFMKAFSNLFDTIGSIPGHYTIRVEPNMKPVQQTHNKVPKESRGKIGQAKLQKIVILQCITHETRPSESVSSLTYPRKSGRSLPVCLDPRDLNKAMLREHDKDPTPDKNSK